MGKNIWLDGMMGLVVGDALGVPVQFLDRDEIKDRDEGLVTGMESGGVFDMPKGTWSDDSSMAIATMDGIIESGILDPEDTMVKFCLWDVKGHYTPFGEAFDQGNTCTTAIYNFLNNPNAMTCGKTGERANGNGALMRILPACLFYYTYKGTFESKDLEYAINGIDMISGLTHNHLRSKMACGLYYFMICEILDSDGNGNLIDILQRGIDNGLKYYGAKIENLTEMAYFGRLFHLTEFKDVPENDIRSSGYVIDSIEAALWCLINTDSYKECMLKVVNLGDDTDTVAAIAGGLAGLFYGYDGIPKGWLDEIQKREWIEEMCDKANEGCLKHAVTPICDIHVHLIPGVDDGSESIDMSMDMLRNMYLQGVRRAFCTSHGGVYFKGEESKTALKLFDKLVQRCQKELPDMELYLGAEVRMIPEMLDTIMEMLNSGQMPTLADSQYVLAEYYNHHGMTFEKMKHSLERLLAEGYIPIIAHMERYYELVPNIEAAKSLHDMGCYIQINAYSVADESSDKIKNWAFELLDEGLVDFIGTDAHRTYHRPPKIMRGVRNLYDRYDKEYVDKMVWRNADELILG